MRDSAPSPDCGFKVNWAKLNNELFALIYADAALRARYDRADAAQARDICSEQFDHLADDAAAFVERFVVLER
ncbi:MAG: hypothetical protein ABR508_09755 [Candidatus Baltobacteraceae bacterium]